MTEPEVISLGFPRETTELINCILAQGESEGISHGSAVFFLAQIRDDPYKFINAKEDMIATLAWNII
jgi:hypothetical protein